MSSYIILRATTIEMLEQAVNDRIKDGFKPFGSMNQIDEKYNSYDCKWYCQPMIKDDAGYFKERKFDFTPEGITVTKVTHSV